MVDKKHKIIQLTDSHLFVSKDEKFLDINPYLNLKQILSKVKNENPDYIIVTGDISHDGSKQSYQYFSDIIKELKINTYWYPGNHDNQKNMNDIFSSNKYLIHKKDFILGNWKFIYVETNIKNKDYGHISDNEIKILDNKIGNTKNNIVLLMHHHPVSVQTPLVDRFIIDNGSVFLDKIKTLKQIKLIICGHVHGDYSVKTTDHLLIECGPATSFQWKKKTKTVKTINCPGYKIYYFNNDNFFSRGEFLK